MPRVKKENPMAKKLVFILVALLLIVLAVWLSIYFNNIFERPYVAVHLANGDTYFGQLYRFPKLQLGDVHIIQPMADPNDSTQTVLQVVPLSLIAFWGPDKLQLNRSQIVFIGKVSEDSQVMTVIRRSKEAPQPVQP